MSDPGGEGRRALIGVALGALLGLLAAVMRRKPPRESRGDEEATWPGSSGG